MTTLPASARHSFHLALAFLFSLLLLPASFAAEKPLRILLLTGGCCHDYATQKEILKKGIEARINAVVDQVHTDDKSTRPPLEIFGKQDYAAGYDLVIHDECAADISDPETVQGVLKPHLGGLPGVNLHCAMHSYRIGRPSEPAEPGTPHGYWFEYLGLQSSSHGPQRPISITFTNRNHPIVRGLDDWSTGNEELYNNVKIFDSATPLAGGTQVVRGRNGASRTNQFVVAWTSEYGPKKARVFSTTIGHNNSTVEDPRYLDLVARGVLWAAARIKEDGTPAEGYGKQASNSGSESNYSPGGNGNFIVGPEYRLHPDLTDKGNPKGKSFEFSMRLADSKIFRGDDPTLQPDRKPVRTERKIFVYIPAAYKDGVKAPIMIMHDGPSRLDLVRNALDNLTISKAPDRKLPPFIAISVQNGGNDGKNSQRGLEYDTMSDRLARFINDEVLPAVLSNAEIKEAYPNLAFTDDPWGRGVMGCSSGGAAALSMAWFRPDLFRRVIAHSGTFVDQQDDDAPEEAKYPLGAWEYHSSMKLIETEPKKPLRIFTHVSENDLRAKDPEETYHNWVMAGERTAAALEAKGYDHRYVFSLDTRHCDRKVFEHTLADTLVWLWRGYQAD